jgi:ABC-type Zn uptake system ZnuABC Zn-binding protein ZnuA
LKKNILQSISWISLLAIFLLTACSPTVASPGEADRLKVVATTTIVGDIVSQVGRDFIDLSVLLPVGADPHSFDPTPQDIAKVAEADLVFANGVGLEMFLDPLLESAGAQEKVIQVSEGIDFLIFGTGELEPDREGAEQDHETGEHERQGADPHTWTDPNNVMIWVQHIEQQLSQADPKNAVTYQANAQAYRAKLESLDAWIQEQTTRIPTDNRKLVTDHALFGYFTEAYGFEQVGALIPGYSTLAEPTAQELATIEDAIQEFGVKAIFVGNTINPDLAERVAQDTGTALVFVYTGSLSEPDGEAPTYLDYMRYNTNAFVEALTPNP